MSDRKRVNIYDDGKTARPSKAFILKDRGSQILIEFEFDGAVKTQWFYRRCRKENAFSANGKYHYNMFDNFWFFRGRETKSFGLEAKDWFTHEFFSENFSYLLD